MMRGGLVCIALVLSACSAGTFRDVSVPMTSMAVFDPSRFAGRWHEVARFSTAPQAECLSVTTDYRPTGSGGLAIQTACQRVTGLTVAEGEAEVTGPGRLRVAYDGDLGATEHWILWVDQGYRTAVIGLPSGREGWIIDREPLSAPDRLQAARDVLEFNGYDLQDLKMISRGAT